MCYRHSEELKLVCGPVITELPLLIAKLQLNLGAHQIDRFEN